MLIRVRDLNSSRRYFIYEIIMRTRCYRNERERERERERKRERER